jgi:hypothetical protein
MDLHFDLFPPVKHSCFTMDYPLEDGTWGIRPEVDDFEDLARLVFEDLDFGL